jgi:hypothetical protein
MWLGGLLRENGRFGGESSSSIGNWLLLVPLLVVLHRETVSYWAPFLGQGKGASEKFGSGPHSWGCEGRELQGIFKCGGAAREGSFRESSSVKLQGKLRNLGRELQGNLQVWGAAEKF